MDAEMSTPICKPLIYIDMDSVVLHGFGDDPLVAFVNH